MDLHIWWLYLTAVVIISSTPGPNMLHVATCSARHGLRRSGFAMAGLLTAVLFCLIASAAGLGALLKTMPQLFTLLRIAGAAYLLYLGYKAWRSPVTGGDDGDGGAVSAPTPVQLYRDALFVGLSNPKLIIFAAALFPQFIDARLPYGPQLVILVGTFAVSDVVWYLIYGLGGARLAGWLGSESRQRLFNRMTGGMFALFGGLLLARSA